MEQVHVYRLTPSTDADGNQILVTPEIWKSFPALVAPVEQVTDTTTEAQPIAYDYTVYIRSQLPTGIRESDLICVRGRMSTIVGTVAVWYDRASSHIGDVVKVARKEG